MNAEATLHHVLELFSWWWIIKAVYAGFNLALLSALSQAVTTLGKIARVFAWLGMWTIVLSPLNTGLGPFGDLLLMNAWLALNLNFVMACRSQRRHDTHRSTNGKLKGVMFDGD